MSQFVGKVEKKIGRMTNNPHLEAKGHEQCIEALEKKNKHNPAMNHGQGYNNVQNNCSSGPYGAQNHCAAGNPQHYPASNQPVSGYQDAYQTAGTHGHHGRGHIGDIADKTKGNAEQFGGSVEQKLGTAVHNPNMQQNGYEHQIRGANEKMSGGRVM
ncbi:hypothetical protein COEREDRAFT_80274 [Coemansia reversa NRRL 1564]|uniref:CsbD-like domain-containing protein n=1 Tax=Coemansia reversa (strain ATCC 12441 / NRRL 1564) TaxID=763665 RepID=A0A2G5BG30_COERN|nr:hypothetical protein COEREDRAFT_80274 [Coemansia reversa NRRL 1564]|eukprot:PIA17976.1 hypothetical protein COEREDRAFT_80274 [Coemansia reversa NRRL 1564]